MNELIELDKLLSNIVANPHPTPTNMKNLIASAKLNTDELLTRQMFEKLMRDGYVKDSNIDYEATFEGVVFSRYGGYTSERETILKIERRKDLREKMLICGTWTAGIGAFALVAWEMYKTYCLHL